MAPSQMFLLTYLLGVKLIVRLSVGLYITPVTRTPVFCRQRPGQNALYYHLCWPLYLPD